MFYITFTKILLFFWLFAYLSFASVNDFTLSINYFSKKIQRLKIVATSAKGMFISEIFDNSTNDDNSSCPMIVTTDNLTLHGCKGDDFTFSIITDASNPPFNYITFYRFDVQQSNPYTSSDTRVWLSEFANLNGSGFITTNDFPPNGKVQKTYYVYACVKPKPINPNDCTPYIEYIIKINTCEKTCNNGIDLLDIDW